jgi:hypothetical protein
MIILNATSESHSNCTPLTRWTYNLLALRARDWSGHDSRADWCPKFWGSPSSLAKLTKNPTFLYYIVTDKYSLASDHMNKLTDVPFDPSFRSRTTQGSFPHSPHKVVRRYLMRLHALRRNWAGTVLTTGTCWYPHQRPAIPTLTRVLP